MVSRRYRGQVRRRVRLDPMASRSVHTYPVSTECGGPRGCDDASYHSARGGADYRELKRLGFLLGNTDRLRLGAMDGAVRRQVRQAYGMAPELELGDGPG